MAINYFSNFPLVEVNGKKARNISLRAAVLKKIKQNENSFYYYTVQDGERPDTVAYDFYGDVRLTWVIFLANDIIDPYFEWPLSTNDFESFLTKKYGSLSQAHLTVKHYKRVSEEIYIDATGTTQSFLTKDEYDLLSLSDKNAWVSTVSQEENIISVDTYNLMSSGQSDYTAVSAYDYEFDLNESRRTIKILNADIVPKLISELENVFN